MPIPAEAERRLKTLRTAQALLKEERHLHCEALLVDFLKAESSRPNHPVVIAALDLLVECRIAQKQFLAAEKLACRTLNWRIMVAGYAYVDTARCMMRLAHIYLKLANLEKCEQVLRQAVSSYNLALRRVASHSDLTSADVSGVERVSALLDLESHLKESLELLIGRMRLILSDK